MTMPVIVFPDEIFPDPNSEDLEFSDREQIAMAKENTGIPARREAYIRGLCIKAELRALGILEEHVAKL